MIAHLFLSGALLAGALVTLAGALAPIYPAADFPNHFRPHTLAATGALLTCALAMRAPRAARWSAALAGLNAALLALPLLWSAATTHGRAVGQALATPGHRDLKIVTFNMAFRHVEKVARFLLQEDADVVVLQEVTAKQAAALGLLLTAKYPHGHSCGVPHVCAHAIFAKRPWREVQHAPRTSGSPEMIWALFDDAEFGRFRLYGLHLALPFRPERQARQVDTLIALSGSLPGPAIFAGDFNMTPWSYQMQRLLAGAGLRRHAIFLRSWPADGQFRLPAPAFPIDHVIATTDIRTVSIRIGPDLGSDHLPVIAVLRLPPS